MLFARRARLDPALAADRARTCRGPRPAGARGSAAPARAALGALARARRRVAARGAARAGSDALAVHDREGRGGVAPGVPRGRADAVDEIVVVDTGSSDRTVEIAESFGARVVSFPWNGSFADARNVSLEHATGDWIMYLDADEQLAPRPPPQLRALLGSTWREAFYLIETNHTGGDERGYGGRPPGDARLPQPPRVPLRGPHPRAEVATRCRRTCPSASRRPPSRIEHYGYLESRVAARTSRAATSSCSSARRRSRRARSPRSTSAPSTRCSATGERAARHFDEAWRELRREDDWQTTGFAPMLAARAARAHRECGRIAEARRALVEAVR